MTEPASLDVLGRLLPSLALIIGALLLVRRWSRRGVAARSGRGVRVLARTGLTRGAVLAVVAVGQRRFLVGATDHGVSLLGELDEQELGSGGFGAEVAEPGAARSDGTVGSLPGTHALRATEGRGTGIDRPRMGLVDRLRAMTLRTHLERPIRAAQG